MTLTQTANDDVTTWIPSDHFRQIFVYLYAFPSLFSKWGFSFFKVPCLNGCMTNKDEIEKLFKAHYEPMYRLARSLLHDGELARDVVHDVFAGMLYTPPDTSVSAGYLLASVRNRCLNIIRDDDLHDRIVNAYFLDMEDYDETYVAATSEDITGLRTTDVRRVEYLEFPIDPRFRGAQRVINIIVQEYVYGGYTKASAYESFLTGLSNEANIYSKFVYKKMTYDFYAETSNYKRRDEGNSIESVYTLADYNGDKYKVDRNLTLGNSKSKNNYYPVSFRALYVADKTQISNTVGFFHNDYKGYETGSLTYSSLPKETGEYYTGGKFRYNGVVYNGSYFFAMRSGWSFDVSSSFSYTHRNGNTDKIERVLSIGMRKKMQSIIV